MAAAARVGEAMPLKRCGSMSDIYREFKSDWLRVVLLGNSWTQRCLVGNLLMNKDVFDVTLEPKVSVENLTLGEKTLTLINTPDLFSDLTEDRLTELVTEVAEVSSPGPHVFLLVLEPESFTEQHQLRLHSILEKFSEKPFDHVIVLLSTDQEENLCSQHVFMERPHLKTVIEVCGYRYQWIKHFEHQTLNSFTREELLTRLAQRVKENSEDYLKYEEYEDTVPPSQIATLGAKMKKGATSLVETVKTIGFTADPTKKIQEEFHFQILSLKISDEKKKTKHTLQIRGKSSRTEWRGIKVKNVKSANLFRMSVPEVIDEMKRCVRKFNQGPNVLLLKPSAFTEKNIEILRLIVSLFGPNAFKHSILVFKDQQNMEPCANSLLEECEGRCHIESTESFDELMMTVKTMVENNKGSFVSLIDVSIPKKKIVKMNLVFCGSNGSEKTQTTKAILGPATCYTPSSSSECVKRQAEVSGRLVSIVELPALSEKPEREVLEECLSCVSMCEPEGVHAFVMMLPLTLLTDVDKAEFKTIQNTFSSRINNFTVILFTVESDPKAEVFTEFVKKHKDIQTLSKSCRGHVFINIKDPQRAPQVLEEIERLMDKSQRFTTETFAKIQIEKLKQTSSKASFVKRRKESEKTLRIVLIGKTGSGKSSSGNSILRRDEFKCGFGQLGTTKLSTKEQSILDGCRVEVVDTPGLFDNDITNDEINDEMRRCISLLAPGPHVFLLVLRIGRFTPEENETLNLIKKGFGPGAQKYTIVLFTHGEELDVHKMSVGDFIKDDKTCAASCQKLISDCGGRCHIFNNRDETKRQHQVNELIQKVDALVEENGGGCYTNEMLKEAEAAIQEEMKRLMEENEKFKREKQEMEDKHKQEMQEIQQRMVKEREETERVRREKDNELSEIKAKINQDQERQKKEQEKRDREEQERREQDRVKRQEYEQKLKKLEEDLQQNFDLKSKESRDKMQQERVAWEEEREEWWQKRHNEDEKRRRDEHIRLEKLEQEYKDKMEKYRKEKEQEDQCKHEHEIKKRKELEQQHNQEIQHLKNKYETEARKQAEEFNEFKKKKEIDFAALIDEHLEELEQKQRECQALQNLATHKETNLKSEMEELQTLHQTELIDLAIDALMEGKKNNQRIKEAQKKHKQEIETCEKRISDLFEKERKRKVEELKKKQNQEIKDLEKSTNKVDLLSKKKDLSDDHEKQIKDLESDLWNKRKEQLKKEVDEIKKTHEDEMNKITKDLLRKNEQHWRKKITELEKKQREEMDKFMEKAGEKVNEVEKDRLKMKHEIEMDKIKKRMLLEEGRCSIL